MREITEREKEIASLREEMGLSYREIGVRFNISISGATQIYKNMLRKRRENQREAFYEAENQKSVLFELTIGEAAILQRILSHYLFEQRNKIRHFLHNSNLETLEKEDIDYVTAGSLLRRVKGMEHQNRASVPEYF